MELSARNIQEKQFHDQWRGYNQAEVDDFLDRVAETVDRLNRENADLRSRITELDQAVAASRDTEEMLKKTLVTAQRAAEEAIAKAKAKAEELVNDAEQRVRQTESDAQERMSTAEADANRRSSEAEAEARRKLTEAESEARRMLSDAERDSDARRRELEEHISKLRSYEADIKQRLKAFLEQQGRALESLIEAPPPAVGRPAAVVAQSPDEQVVPHHAEPAHERRETTPPWGAGAGAFGGPQSPEYEAEESDEEWGDGEAADGQEPGAEDERVFEVPDQDEGEDEDESGEDVGRRGVRDLFFRHQG
jgi:cell division initiation protein